MQLTRVEREGERMVISVVYTVDWKSYPARLVQKPERKMRVICAWCLVVKEEGDEDAPVSHGVCEECTIKLINKEWRFTQDSI